MITTEFQSIQEANSSIDKEFFTLLRCPLSVFLSFQKFFNPGMLYPLKNCKKYMNGLVYILKDFYF